YRAVAALMGQRAISACHDCSDGGLAVALAEMCIGGRLGAELNLDAVPAMQCMNKTELLYSESASRLLVSVKPELAMIFDALGQWQLCSRVGVVTDDARLVMKSGDSVIANEHVEDLARAFKVTLDW
ncbi:MAG: AIR synthase-related protein, partial [Desulfovibrio sp.]|nr:AIR synthase-related protein [Desulfovibrio sp.]